MTFYRKYQLIFGHFGRRPGAGRARNRTGSGLDGLDRAGRRNVPTPDRTADSVVLSGVTWVYFHLMKNSIVGYWFVL